MNLISFSLLLALINVAYADDTSSAEVCNKSFIVGCDYFCRRHPTSTEPLELLVGAYAQCLHKMWGNQDSANTAFLNIRDVGWEFYICDEGAEQCSQDLCEKAFDARSKVGTCNIAHGDAVVIQSPNQTCCPLQFFTNHLHCQLFNADSCGIGIYAEIQNLVPENSFCPTNSKNPDSLAGCKRQNQPKQMTSGTQESIEAVEALWDIMGRHSISPTVATTMNPTVLIQGTVYPISDSPTTDLGKRTPKALSAEAIIGIVFGVAAFVLDLFVLFVGRGFEDEYERRMSKFHGVPASRPENTRPIEASHNGGLFLVFHVFARWNIYGIRFLMHCKEIQLHRAKEDNECEGVEMKEVEYREDDGGSTEKEKPEDADVEC